jgi:hypothetical protein
MTIPSFGDYHGGAARFDADGIEAASLAFREPVHVVRDPRSGAIGVAQGRLEGEAEPSCRLLFLNRIRDPQERRCSVRVLTVG